MEIPGLLERLAEVPDPREPRGVRHAPVVVIALTACVTDAPPYARSRRRMCCGRGLPGDGWGSGRRSARSWGGAGVGVLMIRSSAAPESAPGSNVQICKRQKRRATCPIGSAPSD